MTNIYLTRHGETQWNVEQKLQGHMDSHLTKLGILQAKRLSKALNHIDFSAIYSSSSIRTLRTAEIIRGQRDIAIHVKDALREINMGHWEGQTASDIQDKSPEEYDAFWKSPHLYQPANEGESFYDLRDRVLPVLKEMISMHEGENVLIVTHSATLKMIMSYFESRPLEKLWDPPIIRPTALCKVVIEEKAPIIELYGDISHYIERID